MTNYFLKTTPKLILKKIKDRTSVNPKDTQWIEAFVGTYKNPDLGIFTIKKSAEGFEIVTERWTSTLGSYQDVKGDTLLVKVSPPLTGLTLQIQKEPIKKLILDAAQIKYEFTPCPDATTAVHSK